MRIGFDNVKRAMRDGDFAEAVATIRHGLAWRVGRLARRLSRLLARLAAPAPAHVLQSPMNGRLEMTSSDSLDAANATLRAIGALDRERTAEVRVPELSVAVIVPTYADSEFLGDALRSLETQTFRNWRCYVVDDASPDDVDVVMAEFRDDDRFLLLRHGANGGLAAARNTGIRHATEDVLQFLDADDMLTPWALECRVEELRRRWHDPLIAGTFGQVLQCPEETQLADLETWTATPSLWQRDWLAVEGECPFSVHAPLVRTELIKRIGGFDESFVNGAEDWDLWHRLLRHGYTFTPAPATVGAYRQRRSSMIREHSGVHLGRATEFFAAAEQWVDVDPDIAVGNARMPIGDGRLALRRLTRAARLAGFRAVQLASVDEAIDEQILSLLDPAATVGTRRDECYRAARSGVIRGLGLADQVINGLAGDAAQVVESTAWRIADALLGHCADHDAFPKATLDLTNRTSVGVLMLPETVNDVQEFLPLLAQISSAGVEVGIVDLDYVNGAHGARTALSNAGIATIPFNAVALGRVVADVVVARSLIMPGTAELLQLAADDGATPCLLNSDESLLLNGEGQLSTGRSLRPNEILALATRA